MCSAFPQTSVRFIILDFQTLKTPSTRTWSCVDDCLRSSVVFPDVPSSGPRRSGWCAVRVRHSLTMSRRRHRPRPRYFLTVQAAQATEDASGPHGTLGTPGWGVGDVAFEFTLEGVDLLDTVGTLRLAVEDKFFIPRTHQLLCGPLPSPQPLADDDATLLSLGIVPGRVTERPSCQLCERGHSCPSDLPTCTHQRPHARPGGTTRPGASSCCAVLRASCLGFHRVPLRASSWFVPLTRPPA